MDRLVSWKKFYDSKSHPIRDTLPNQPSQPTKGDELSFLRCTGAGSPKAHLGRVPSSCDTGLFKEPQHLFHTPHLLWSQEVSVSLNLSI